MEAFGLYCFTFWGTINATQYNQAITIGQATAVHIRISNQVLNGSDSQQENLFILWKPLANIYRKTAQKPNKKNVITCNQCQSCSLLAQVREVLVRTVIVGRDLWSSNPSSHGQKSSSEGWVSLHSSQVASPGGTHPCFHGMKGLGVLLFPPPPPSISSGFPDNSPVPTNTHGWREAWGQ